MLLKIRDILTGWIAAAFVVLLIIPFAFWGINYYFGSGGKVSAMEVNGTKVSLQEFQRAYQNIRQRYQQMTGQSVPAEQEPALKQNTVDSLIDSELIKQVNQSMGIRISDRRLTDTIKGISEFQGPNGFDNTTYRQLISRMGFNPASFEAQMRSDMEATQLQAAITKSAFVTHQELTRIESLIKQKRDITYATLSSSDLKDSIKVSDADVKKYYDEHSQQYMDPEQVKIAYVELSLNNISASIKVTDKALKEYYESNKSMYEVEEQRKFKDLFIAAGKDATPEQVAKASSEVQSLYQDIEKGASFKDAVAAEKNDKSPHVEVIDQDYMTKGIMEPEVDNVLFSQKVGDLSKPIKTDSGFHIIKLEAIKGGTSSSFDEVKDQVAKDYRASLAEPKFADAADQMTNLAFEQPDSLFAISDKLGLPIHKSPFFNRQWQPNDFLRDPKIVKASFSDDVLQAGNNSEPIEIGENDLVVLRVTDHKPARKKPLAEVHDRIVTQIKFERARDETRSKGEAIISDLKQKKISEDDEARKEGFIWQRKTGIKRDDPEIDGAILRAAFSLGRPKAGQKIYGGDSLASGDYAIVIVSSVEDGKPGDVTDKEKEALQKNLVQSYTNDYWVQFLNDLKSKAKIHVYKNNL